MVGKIYPRRCHEILVTKLFRQNNRNNDRSIIQLAPTLSNSETRNTPPSLPLPLSSHRRDRKPIKHPIRTPNLPNNPNSNSAASVPLVRCLRLPFYYFLRPRENAIGIACTIHVPTIGADDRNAVADRWLNQTTTIQSNSRAPETRNISR